MKEITVKFTGLMFLSILLIVLVGCAPGTPTAAPVLPASTLPPSTPTTVPSTVPAPEVPAGWEAYSASANGQCGYTINHPSEMEVVSQGTYSWLLNHPSPESDAPVPNFIFVSVIPNGFQSEEPGVIYNYDPRVTQTLLDMQVGESKPLHQEASLATWYTYTRLPDVVFVDQPAKAYENTQPWEFPAGTKEIRYYLQANGCTYLVGGYMSMADPGQAGGIDEALFKQIIAEFRPSS